MGNLPRHVTKESLLAFFSDFGPIHYIEVREGSRFRVMFGCVCAGQSIKTSRL